MMDRLLIDKVIQSVKNVYDHDEHLILYPGYHGRKTYHVGERAIVFRFAHYLLMSICCDKNLKNYDLDVEYNRNNEYKKWLELDKNTSGGVAPDVIIHKRASNEHNLLVIEVKGYWCKKNDAIQKDKKKIAAFTKQNSTYNFDLGMYIELGKTYNECIIELYKDGKAINKIYCSEI